jgi:tetratricopeptide (TPR) repeat protein
MSVSGRPGILLFILALILAPAAAFTVGTGTSSAGGTGSAGSTPVMTADELYNKGVALSDAGRHPEALDQFQKAAAARPDFAEAYNMIGFTYRKLGRLSLSVQSYEKALKLRPQFAEAHEYMGETYLAGGDLLHAMQQYIYLKNAGNSQAQELWEKIADYVGTKTRA